MITSVSVQYKLSLRWSDAMLEVVNRGGSEKRVKSKLVNMKEASVYRKKLESI